MRDRSETQIKLDDLLGLLSEAVYDQDQKKIEQLRPKITKLMKAFHAEEDEKKK